MTLFPTCLAISLMVVGHGCVCVFAKARGAGSTSTGKSVAATSSVIYLKEMGMSPTCVGNLRGSTAF